MDTEEALDDALENAAMSDWDVENIELPKVDNISVAEEVELEEDIDNEVYYHVALYLKGEDSND